MDTSEKYIEMCRDADEIQKLKPPEESAHAYFYCTEHKRFLEYNSELEYQWCGGWKDWHGSDDEKRVIWLPRQDQLQDMINCITGKVRGYGFMREFHDFWVAKSNRDYIAENNFHTHEQLLLAYVMNEKYGKRWDGTAWVDPDAPKESPKSLLSEILEAHTEVKAGNFKPVEVWMSRKSGIALSGELINTHHGMPLVLVLGSRGRILNMKVVIDDTIPDDEFRIVAEPL